MTLNAASIYKQFCARTLPFEDWTHEAHLAVCWRDLQERSPDESLVFLRRAIRSYNTTVGTVNSDSSGYHETLTIFYVAVISSLAAPSLDLVLRSPLTDRGVPLRFWTRDRLFSVEARRRWIEPDIQGLDFEVPGQSSTVSATRASFSQSLRPNGGQDVHDVRCCTPDLTRLNER